MLPDNASSPKSAFSSERGPSLVEERGAFMSHPSNSPRRVPFFGPREDVDGDVFMSRSDDDVATCVTLEEDGSSEVPSSPIVMNQNYAEVIASALPNPVAFNVANDRRKFFYTRHHPSQAVVTNCMTAPSDVKNKNRFSATGASGLSSVVRDSKMSLSSSPPSPRPGSLSGHYCKSMHHYYHNHFQPIPVVMTSCLSAATTTFSPTKKESFMSTSPTFSLASQRSSTFSLTGSSSRKRRADDDVHRCSGYSSTSEVAAAVGHVNLHDRLSTGSISPSEQILGQPHKRSKNDNEEEDDVIFVSYEPGQGAKGNATFVNPFCPPPSSHLSKSSSKGRKKKANCALRSNVGSFVAANVSSSSTVSRTTSNSPIDHVAPQVPVTASPLNPSNRYFLRSCVNRSTVKKNDVISRPEPVKVTIQKTKITTENESRDASKSFCRDQRKPKKDKPVGKAVNVAVTKSPQAAPKVEKNHNFSKPAFNPEAVTSRDREQPSFKTTYDIKGQIGVGGGGVVFAGTRKSDLTEVAIKRVPKEKVRRWGKLGGRNVPLEFELLDKASRGENKGVIRMYDWYERSKSFILVMERPQPVIDLFDYLNQHGAMKEAMAKRIFRQIVKAVNHFHGNGVVHRDIKDENVLLNLHTLEAKVIDFGCGTYLKDKVYTEFAGTPEFYPPEWFRERKYHGKKVDAWSLGVLLYTMLESEVPFPKEKDTLNCQWKFKRSKGLLTSSCIHLVEAMLQKDQEKRPTLDEVLQHPWLQEEDTSAASNDSFQSPSSMSRTTSASTDCASSTKYPQLNTSGSVISQSSADTSSSTVITIKDSPDSPPPPYSPHNSSCSTFYGFSPSTDSSKSVSVTSSPARSTIDYSRHCPRDSSGSDSLPPFPSGFYTASSVTSQRHHIDEDSSRAFQGSKNTRSPVYIPQQYIPKPHFTPTRSPHREQCMAPALQSPTPHQSSFISLFSPSNIAPPQVWRSSFLASPEHYVDSRTSLFSPSSKSSSHCSPIKS